MAFRLSLFAVFSFVLISASAQAAGPYTKECQDALEQCAAQCEERNADSLGGLAGCKTRCTTANAACEAEANYNKAKPFLENLTEEAKRFVEELFGGAPMTPAPKEMPSPLESDDQDAGKGQDT